MKKIYLILFIVFHFCWNIQGQTPTGFNYQAVIRNSDGKPLESQSAQLRVSLTSNDGTTVYYSEVHSVQSNPLGLVNLVIGSGEVISGSLQAIPFSAERILLSIDLKLDGQTSFYPMGSQQLQAVPYALYAASGLTGPAGANGISLQWLGAFPSEPSSPTLNQAYYNSSDRRSYVWDGDSWEVIAMDGNTGPQGAEGPQGTVGPQGAQGIQGPVGPQGPAGVGLTLRGSWSADSTYSDGDYVFSESTDTPGVNSMWICQVEVGPSAILPRNDGEHWVEFEAPTGPEGPQGPVGPQGAAGSNGISIVWLGEFISAPQSPELNNAYYNSTDKISYIWDGDSWETLAKDGTQSTNGISVPGNLGQMLVNNGTAWAATSAIMVNSDTVAIGTNSTVSRLIVQGESSALPEDPIFEVKNKDGKVVFGVYNEGVRVYVADGTAKGVKGGFAVGGLTNQTKGEVEYFRITPDSARIYVNEYPSSKGVKGGFAVGGLTNQTKTITSRNLLFINPDSARIYIDDSTATKGVKGGFAVGGLTNQTKGGANNYLYIHSDSSRIYINDTGAKGVKGGFAVGGLTNQTKSGSYDLLRVSTDSTRIYVNKNLGKGAKGGFAVGGLTNQTKELASQFLNLTPENYFIGENAGKSISTGLYNSFLGYQAGYSSTTASNNLFLGYNSGYSNILGNYNTLMGYEAGYSNNASNNTFIGYQVGKNNTEGFSNVFIGNDAGFSNDSGYYNVFIGNESGYLNTKGGSNVFVGFNSGYSNSTGVYNVFIGDNSGYANTTGERNVFIGKSCGQSNTTGLMNVFIGNDAGSYNTEGYYNVFMGYVSGTSNTKGNMNVFLGNNSGFSNTLGSSNVFLGSMSGTSNTEGGANVYLGNRSGMSNILGNSNVMIGDNSGENATEGSDNVFLGNSSGRSNKGSYNTFLGYQTGFSNSEGQYNAFIGYQAGLANTAGNNNIFIGKNSGSSNTDGSWNTMLGFEAGLVSNADYNTFIGYQTGYSNTSAGYNTFIGYQSGLNYTTGEYNTFIGYQTGLASASSKGTGKNNVAIGYKAGISLTYGENNVFIGTEAGGSTTGVLIDTVRGENTFIGYWAGKDNTSGYQNIAIGYLAGMRLSNNNRNTLVGTSAGQELSSGLANSFFGTYAGRLTTSGTNNTFVGYDCGYQCYTGSYNTFIGFQAGRGWGVTEMGDSSVFIGNQAGVNESGSNLLYISNSETTTPLIWGNFKLGYATVHGNLGINTKAPGYSIEAYGANASIIAHYASNTRGGISAFPSYRLAFLTTDVSNDLVFGYSPDPDQPDFSTAFVERMRIDNGTGYVGIGTTAPTYKFDVAGTARTTQSTYLATTSGYNVGIGTTSPSYKLDVAGTLNLNNGISSGIAMKVNGSEVLWFNGTYLNWGYGATYTNFATPVNIGDVNNHTTDYKLYVAGNAYTTGSWSSSDIRWKKNIVPLSDVLKNLLLLNGVKYEWKTDEYPKMNFDKNVHIGFIAQDVEKLFPELVLTDADGYKSVAYDKFSAILLEGIKDQQQQIDSLKEENVILKEKIKEIEELKAELEAIKQLIK